MPIDFQTFCADPQLLNEPISPQWATFYKAVEGLPLTDEERGWFVTCSGRETYEPRTYVESTALVGRRAEKTTTAVKFALWKSLFGGFENSVRRGDLLRCPIICQDLRISKDTLRAAQTLLRNSPVLVNEIAEDLTSEIRLRNGLSFMAFPCTVTAPRGLSCPIVIADELAFWQAETGANPDVEVLRAIRPSMIRFGDSRRLLKISTPWMKQGVVYDEFSRRSEKPDILLWNASTAFMTPRVSRDDLEKERAADPSYFAREYEAQFTDDAESFLPIRDIDAAIRSGVSECKPVNGIQYFAAIDASSLTGRDTFAFGIAHHAARGNSNVGASVDLLRGWTRSPVNQVLDEVALLAKAYGITTITADQHAFQFLAELMRQRKIELEQLAFTVRSKSEVFLDLKVSLAQGSLGLLDHTPSLREPRSLESKKTSGGHFSIAAPRSSHDDFACVIALLAHRGKSGSSVDFVYWPGMATTAAQPTKAKTIAPDDPRFWPTRRGAL